MMVSFATTNERHTVDWFEILRIFFFCFFPFQFFLNERNKEERERKTMGMGWNNNAPWLQQKLQNRKQHPFFFFFWRFYGIFTVPKKLHETSRTFGGIQRKFVVPSSTVLLLVVYQQVEFTRHKLIVVDRVAGRIRDRQQFPAVCCTVLYLLWLYVGWRGQYCQGFVSDSWHIAITNLSSSIYQYLSTCYASDLRKTQDL